MSADMPTIYAQFALQVGDDLCRHFQDWMKLYNWDTADASEFVATVMASVTIFSSQTIASLLGQFPQLATGKDAFLALYTKRLLLAIEMVLEDNR